MLDVWVTKKVALHHIRRVAGITMPHARSLLNKWSKEWWWRRSRGNTNLFPLKDVRNIAYSWRNYR